MTPSFRILSLALLAGATLLSVLESPASGQIHKFNTAKVRVKNRTYVGFPMAHDGQYLALLRRDGRLSTLPVSDPSVIQQVSKKFRPYSSDKIRQNLQKEFGAKYQVSVTRNFVVVHPQGDFTVWALPFEQLYQRFRNYFTSRGLSPDKPEFPMVAIVLRTRNEFDRFLKAYHEYDRQVLGYYSPRSNRIITYDPSNGKSSNKNWAFQETLIHEAVHQTAYNTGIHSRFSPNPRWIPEGLATMFEAKGVNNSQYYSTRKDRINRGRLDDLKYFFDQGKVKGKLDNLVAYDSLFRSDPGLAYAMAWGLTFFLAERYPKEYFAYLKKDANREEFMQYKRRDRVRDFAKQFGSDFNSLEKQLERFIKNM